MFDALLKSGLYRYCFLLNNEKKFTTFHFRPVAISMETSTPIRGFSEKEPCWSSGSYCTNIHTNRHTAHKLYSKI